MSFAITDKCVGCHACFLVCPNHAVYQDPEVSRQFRIHPKRCDQCEGHYEESQCASICPVEEAIVDGFKHPLNPVGSLQPEQTGRDS